MTDYQSEKAIIRRYQQELIAVPVGEVGAVLARYMAGDITWNGSHPFNTLVGPGAVAEHFWEPFKHALPHMMLRNDIFMAGTFAGANWVCSTGHLAGNFERDWLGIRPTNRLLFIRYGAFYRVEAGKIAEVFTIYDLIGVMQQVGLQPLPQSTGVEVLVPGPATHDGLLYDEQPAEAGQKSLQLVEDMLYLGLAGHHETDMPAAALAEYWHRDMVWFGPAGIGTTYGISGFKTGHQIPFRKALSGRRGGDHKCRIGEGHYVASTGWPSYRATLSAGGWMGLPATGQPITMRVMDWWRREGDLLRENWVFIDIPDLLMQMDHDVLKRTL